MDQPIVNIPEEVLSSLCTRFLINIPDEERNDLIRAFFQIELAHWFYIDFFRVEQQGLPNCGMKEFSKAIFKHCPFLIDHADKVDKLHAEWREYKMSVPTYGGILLDTSLTHLVMVQGFFSRTSWGFPKGKVNKEELPVQCAIREVREEIGFDVTNYIDENNYIETYLNDQLARLYVVPNIPMDVDFKPITRGEIKEVRWFLINDLPASKKDPAPKVNLGLNPNHFFMVIPFIKPLKKRLNKMQQSGSSNRGTYSPSAILSSNSNTQSQRTQSPTQGNYRQSGGRGRGGNNNHVVNTNGGPTSQTTPDSNKVETRRKQQQQSFKAQNMNAITQYSRFKDPALDAMWNNQGGVGLKQRQKSQGGGGQGVVVIHPRHRSHRRKLQNKGDIARSEFMTLMLINKIQRLFKDPPHFRASKSIANRRRIAANPVTPSALKHSSTSGSMSMPS
ncbi:m7GpppN-mRNA hydrolase isoform X1 [Strongylocentrotus purpuratus]|uniref:m7GpppN-mRNA hydrolase n=2 Tax=Strongylocentrotus purpuratus TaxID=7668 RepID=A0A7M7RBI1_STRPU|nr:m7GpppN-mRNA hydrolase isoform X1 [Strongylocentrotus purpuratus]